MVKFKIFILLMIYLTACDDDGKKKFPVSILDMSECHHEKVWSDSLTRLALIGTWQWEFAGYAYTGTYVDDEEYTIEFKTDDTAVVRQHDTIVQKSGWQVIIQDADLYGIESEPYIDHTWGRIYFCDQRILIQGSYLDVSDNFYRKIN